MLVVRSADPCPVPRTPWLTAAGVGFAGFALLSWLVTRTPDPGVTDRAVRQAVLGTRRPGLTWLARAVTLLGWGPALVVVGLLAALLLWRWARQPLLAAVLVAALTLTAGTVYLLKIVFARGRPTTATLLGLPSLDGSYPSGHTTDGTVLWGLVLLAVGLATPRRLVRVVASTAWVLVAAGIGWSRVYLGYHWPSDVLGGWLLAVGVLGVTVAAVPASAWPDRPSLPARPSRAALTASRQASAEDRLATRTPSAVLVGIALLAFAARLVPVLRGGGLHGLGNYDDGVDYAAASALVHGALPYRDFLLLHPPGVLLVLAPAAALGAFVGDPTGLAVGRVAFMALGAVNALLVARVVRPLGVPAAVAAALFYAVFPPAAYIEHSTLLEGSAATWLLLALALLTRRAQPSDRQLLAAGALLGLAAATKIWGIVPATAVVAWALPTLGRRAALRVAGGAALGAGVVCLPFFVAAPGRMWRYVVLDQLGRPRSPVSLTGRVANLAGWHDRHLAVPGAVALAVLVAAAAVLACRERTGRLAVTVLVASLVLLVSTPSWFYHYAGLAAAPLALVLGAAVATVHRRLGARRPVAVRRVLAATLVVVGLGGLTAAATGTFTSRFGTPFAAAALRHTVAQTAGCVTTDDPTTLVELDVLRRDLDHSCRVVVDLGGYHYDLPSSGPGRSRAADPRWQAFALRYLRSGSLTVLDRFHAGAGFSRRTARAVERWPLLAQVGGAAVRRPGAPPPP